MADQTVIINRAYVLLGKDRIVGPGDDSAHTVAMLEQFDLSRDAVISAYPWDFSLVDVQIAAEVETPAFTWGYQYILPTKPYCLKAWVAGTADPPNWVVKGRRLLIDEAGPLNLTYGAQITDPALFDPGFVEALATYLAWLFAYRITRKRANQDKMWQYYLTQVQIGRSADGQQGVPQVKFNDSYLKSRH